MFDGEPVHAEDLSNLGIDYLCAPLSEDAPPREGNIEIRLESLPRGFDFVTKNREMGRISLVQCRQGRKRIRASSSPSLLKAEMSLAAVGRKRKLESLTTDCGSKDAGGDFVDNDRRS